MRWDTSPGRRRRRVAYTRFDVADLPCTLAEPALRERLAAALDADGKIPRTLDSLGPIADRDVLLFDADDGLRAGQLRALGGRVTVVPRDVDLGGLDREIADVAVILWDPKAEPTPECAARYDAMTPLLRPGGRLLVLLNYGRDDVARLLPGAERAALDYASLRQRDTWFLRRGFKLRVIHGWWTFETIEDAASFLSNGFGEAGADMAVTLRRPRLSHKMVVYHRTQAPEVAAAADGALAAGTTMAG